MWIGKGQHIKGMILYVNYSCERHFERANTITLETSRRPVRSVHNSGIIKIYENLTR